MAELDDIMRQLMEILNNGLISAFPSIEEQEAELREVVQKNKNGTVESVSIDDNVTVHFLAGFIRYRESVVRLLSQLQANYPAPGKVEVYFPAVWKPGPMRTEGGNVGIPQGLTSRWDFDTNTITFSGNDRLVLLTESAVTASGSVPGWHMPVYDNGWADELEYTIVHEWGHVLDNRERTIEAERELINHLTDVGIVVGGFFTPEFGHSLSDYARDNEAETFAETFAEWAISMGNTSNFASRWYAHEYGWGRPKSTLNFRGRITAHTNQ